MSHHPACDLFQRCLQRRSSDDWRVFVQRYEPRLRRMIHCAVARRPDWEYDEFLQDLYVKLWTTTNFGGATESEFWAWIYKIMRRMAVDRYRSYQRRHRLNRLVRGD